MKNVLSMITSTICMVAVVIFASCQKEENHSKDKDHGNLLEITSFETSSFTISLFNELGKLQTGYNPLSIQIRNENNEVIIPDYFSLHPFMHMGHHGHGAPFSTFSAKDGSTDYHTGFVVFQMPSHGDDGYWELEMGFSYQGVDYELTGRVEVMETDDRLVESFQDDSERNYVLALQEPSRAKVGLQDVSALLFRQDESGSFIPVDHYLIDHDPRMPTMDNHGSPNNQAMAFDQHGLYKGRLSLTMTGFWRLNLQVFDENNKLIKGNPVDEDNPKSNIYFEISF